MAASFAQTGPTPPGPLGSFPVRLNMEDFCHLHGYWHAYCVHHIVHPHGQTAYEGYLREYEGRLIGVIGAAFPNDMEPKARYKSLRDQGRLVHLGVFPATVRVSQAPPHSQIGYRSMPPVGTMLRPPPGLNPVPHFPPFLHAWVAAAGPSPPSSPEAEEKCGKPSPSLSALAPAFVPGSVSAAAPTPPSSPDVGGKCRKNVPPAFVTLTRCAKCIDWVNGCGECRAPYVETQGPKLMRYTEDWEDDVYVRGVFD